MTTSTQLRAIAAQINALADGLDGAPPVIVPPVVVPPVLPPPLDTTGYPSPASIGVARILRQDISFERPPSDGGRIYFRNFRSDEALVLRFVVPAAGNKFTLDITHSGGAIGSSIVRTYTLSSRPGDVSVPASPDAVWAAETNVMSLRMRTGGWLGGLLLVPGRTMYANVINRAYGRNAAPEYCGVFVTVGGI